MKDETTSITAKDGHSLECYTVTPDQPAIGGLVILQEIFGVTDQLKNLARRYASLGYKVAVPALFDRQSPKAVIPFNQAPKGMELMAAANMEQTLLDIDTAVLSLKNHTDKVVVMGFCWGGGLALRSAQKLKINGAIVFYGTRLVQYLDCPLQAPVLGHFGNEDHHVPAADLQQVQNYFPQLETHIYEAGHAFANDFRESFVESAATLARERNEQFLKRVLSS